MTEQELRGYLQMDDSIEIDAVIPCKHGFKTVLWKDSLTAYFIEGNPSDITLGELLDMKDGFVYFIGEDWQKTLTSLKKMIVENVDGLIMHSNRLGTLPLSDDYRIDDWINYCEPIKLHDLLSRKK